MDFSPSYMSLFCSILAFRAKLPPPAPKSMCCRRFLDLFSWPALAGGNICCLPVARCPHDAPCKLSIRSYRCHKPSAASHLGLLAACLFDHSSSATACAAPQTPRSPSRCVLPPDMCSTEYLQVMWPHSLYPTFAFRHHSRDSYIVKIDSTSSRRTRFQRPMSSLPRSSFYYGILPWHRLLLLLQLYFEDHLFASPIYYLFCLFPDRPVS